LADEAAGLSPSDLRRRIDTVHGFLVHSVLRLSRDEVRAVYPVLSRLLAGPPGSVPLTREHEEVTRLVNELAELRHRLSRAAITGTETKDLRRILYGLDLIVRLHFEKEEQLMLPFLERRLSEAEARCLYETLSRGP
jgi:hypothetical protein